MKNDWLQKTVRPLTAGDTMLRTIFILFLVMSILGSGCQTYSPEIQAVWQKYRMVKPGMTSSEVFSIEPPPEGTARTVAGNQMASWSYGSPLADEDYAYMDVVFGQDGRVVRVHREHGHGHAPHDLAMPVTVQ